MKESAGETGIYIVTDIVDQIIEEKIIPSDINRSD